MPSTRRWPPPLRHGDRIVAIAPAGPPNPARVERGLALLRSWGLDVVLGEAVWEGDDAGFLAASDTRRAADLATALSDPAVAGVVCLRGGYGCQRLLDLVELRQVAPKPFVGFSDVTALHVALGQRSGMVTFHGPSLQWDDRRLPEDSRASLHAALFGDLHTVLDGEPLVAGTVTAPLVGGNLTILASLCGTPDQLDARGQVLLVEDVGEAPYRLDRALLQLRRAGVTEGIVGLAFDDFHGCHPPPGSSTAREVAATHADELGVPAVYGLPLGHGQGQRTVPLGGLMTLDGTAGTLEVHPRPDPTTSRPVRRLNPTE